MSSKTCLDVTKIISYPLPCIKTLNHNSEFSNGHGKCVVNKQCVSITPYLRHAEENIKNMRSFCW